MRTFRRDRRRIRSYLSALLGNRRVECDEPTMVTAGELASHGLERRPDAVGIYWPDSQVMVCRTHYDDAQTRRMTRTLRDRDETAVVVRRPVTAGRISFMCAAARPVPLAVRNSRGERSQSHAPANSANAPIYVSLPERVPILDAESTRILVRMLRALVGPRPGARHPR